MMRGATDGSTTVPRRSTSRATSLVTPTMVKHPRKPRSPPAQLVLLARNVAVGWRATSSCSAAQEVAARRAGHDRGGGDHQFDGRARRVAGRLEVPGDRREPGPQRSQPSPADGEPDTAVDWIDHPSPGVRADRIRHRPPAWPSVLKHRRDAAVTPLVTLAVWSMSTRFSDVARCSSSSSSQIGYPIVKGAMTFAAPVRFNLGTPRKDMSC